MKRPERKDLECSTGASVPRMQPAPSRPVPKCDPPVTPPERVFTAPEVPIVNPTLPTFPDPYLFDSLYTELPCSLWPAYVSGELPTGTAGVSAAGEFQLPLYLQSLGFESTSLQYITEALRHSDADSRLMIDEGQAEALSYLFNVSVTQAQQIIDAAVVIKEELQSRATAAAFARLSCSWGNDEVFLYCPDSAVETAGSNPIQVAANAFFSAISKEDADAQALAAAQSALFCVWESDEVSAVCSDLSAELADLDPGQPDLATGGTLGEELPGTGLPHPSEDGRLRTNKAVVAAGEFSSEVSRADANAQALAYAVTFLDCFYSNTRQVVLCDSESGQIPPLETPVDYDGVALGNPVTIAEHTVASETSWDEADKQAELLARASLSCVWANSRLIYSCDDFYSDPADPEQVAAHAVDLIGEGDLDFSDTLAFANKIPHVIFVTAYGREVNFYAIPDHPDSSYTVEIAEQAFTSEISQEDADQLAATHALSQLRCIYCNPDIQPACDDPTALSYTVAVPGVKYAYYDEEGRPLEDSAGNPIFYERPVSARLSEFNLTHLGEGLADIAVFCGLDPFQVATTADLLGSVPLSSLKSTGAGSVCEYGNDPTYAACDGATMVGVDTDLTAQFHVPPHVTNPAELSPLSTSGYQYLARDTVSAPSKEEANEQAKMLALASLDCFFANDTVVQLCPEGVDEDSTGHPTNPVIIPAELMRSYVSKADAQQAAEALALALLYCFWRSPEVSLDCGTDFSCVIPSGSGSLTIPAGAVTSSFSADEALELATTVGRSQLQCLWSNARVEMFCGAGETAPAGGCAADLTMPTAVGPYAACLHPDSVGGLSAVVVEAETFFSEISVADANQQAWDHARSQLQCFWGNAQITLQCGPTGPSSFAGCTGAITDGGDPDVAVQSIGSSVNPVIIGANLITSDLGPGEATTQAYALAYATLDCYYLNDTQVATCAGGEGNAPDGVYESVIDAEVVEHRLSKAGANELALKLAEAGLVCLYCNEEQTGDDTCPGDCYLFNISTVPPCTVLSTVSLADANVLAKAMALAYTFCVDADGIHLCGGGGSDGSAGGGGGGGGGVGFSGDSGSGGGSGSSPGSGKDNAIVPAPWLGENEFVAWFTHEMPDVRFSDIMEVTTSKRITTAKIDPRVIASCEEDTLRVVSAVGSSHSVLWARRSGSFVVFELAGEPVKDSCSVMITLSGIRKGFRDLRMPRKTLKQFLANEEHLNSAYPKDVHDV